MECWTEIGYQLQLQSYPTSQRKKTVSQFGEKHNYHLFLMCVKSYWKTTLSLYDFLSNLHASNCQIRECCEMFWAPETMDQTHQYIQSWGTRIWIAKEIINVIKTIINHPYGNCLVYTTHLLWFWGWLAVYGIVLTTLYKCLCWHPKRPCHMFASRRAPRPVWISSVATSGPPEFPKRSTVITGAHNAHNAAEPWICQCLIFWNLKRTVCHCLTP